MIEPDELEAGDLLVHNREAFAVTEVFESKPGHWVAACREVNMTKFQSIAFSAIDPGGVVPGLGKQVSAYHAAVEKGDTATAATLKAQLQGEKIRVR